MIGATDLKVGVTFQLDKKPYKVVKYTFQKVGRGGASVKLGMRNLINGNLEERTYSSDIKFDEISTTKRVLQYLYSDTLTAYFYDPKTYEQIEVPISIVKEELSFTKEGENASILFWDDKPLSLEISPKVVLKVTETAPGVKGNSATNMYKPAKLENGLNIKVPLFVNEGENIVVDTRNGTYVERAK